MHSPQKEETIELKNGNFRIIAKKEEAFVYYATFVAGEYNDLQLKPTDLVIDTGLVMDKMELSEITEFVIKYDNGEYYAKLQNNISKLVSIFTWEPYAKKLIECMQTDRSQAPELETLSYETGLSP